MRVQTIVGVAAMVSKSSAVSFAVSPHGIDPERKTRAVDGANRMNRAGTVLTVLTAGAGVVFPPMVPGLALAAVVAPVLATVFNRIAADPPRVDFTLPVIVRRFTLDPSIAWLGSWSWEDGVISRTPGLVIALDRGSAYLEAWLIGIERAMGAYEARSWTATDLRLAESRRYLRLANASLNTAAHIAQAIESDTELAARLMSEGGEIGDAVHARGTQLTFERARQGAAYPTWQDIVSPDALMALREAGMDDEQLRAYVDLPFEGVPSVEALGQGMLSAVEFVESVSDGMPTTEEFIEEGEAARSD
jgi:hypothetical protein